MQQLKSNELSMVLHTVMCNDTNEHTVVKDYNGNNHMNT